MGFDVQMCECADVQMGNLMCGRKEVPLLRGVRGVFLRHANALSIKNASC
jgi:hypothetical protein